MPLSCMLFLVGLSIALPTVLALVLMDKMPTLSLIVGSLGIASMCGAFGLFYSQFPELWSGWPNLIVIVLGTMAVIAFIALCAIFGFALDERTKE